MQTEAEPVMRDWAVEAGTMLTRDSSTGRGGRIKGEGNGPRKSPLTQSMAPNELLILPIQTDRDDNELIHLPCFH